MLSVIAISAPVDAVARPQKDDVACADKGVILFLIAHRILAPPIQEEPSLKSVPGVNPHHLPVRTK